ncbi:hypothetical protein JRQ81_001428 [Phrynocephalus forsythii]|uniref:FAD-binding PCMH-type domain-containing protein n=1 Tax=Phrynocephalus forsythii TaxID=171643 RepID=A0A9Q0YC52_9SAUR|nr:hypothetical protein JRQ81_001428 [Phrynocephalus forsythii]
MISMYNPVSNKILHYSANACLIPICSLYGAAVTTVEGIGSTKSRIHPVQERIAKSHGSQCGFCTPGMVMSVYTLLQNHAEPSSKQLYEALAGNLCRCTGYRPIVEGCKIFCKTKCNLGYWVHIITHPLYVLQICRKLFTAEEFQPQEATQKLTFPPELILMATDQHKRTLVFHGERMTWISPLTLKELLELKSKFPKAPLVVGNTIVGPNMKFKDACHPIIISPSRIFDLSAVIFSKTGLTLGAACSLSFVKAILVQAVSDLPLETTQIFLALLKQLKHLGGPQIRNIASLGGNVLSRHPSSDLNPLLAAGRCVLNVASLCGTRQILLNEDFLDASENAVLLPDEVLLSVYIPYSKKGEFVSAFRQAERRENALSLVNAGMRVAFKPDSAVIADLSIFYGGIASTTVCAKKSCQLLIGRSWNKNTLEEACQIVSEELLDLDTTPEGTSEYKRTLITSFIFKFYLQTLKQLNQMNTFILFVFYVMKQDINPDQFSYDPVGCPLMHLAGIKHATGEALYCDDIHPTEKELSLVLVTSSRAHAEIVSIDTSQALSWPGVVDVITADDVPGTNEFCYITEPESLFATEKVTCVGQIVCAVVADSAARAKRAAAKVKITYKALEPIVLTIEDAIKHTSFFSPERKLEQGNVQEGFDMADHILEGEVHIGGQEHFYMETQSMLVIPKGEDKEMDIYVSAQHPTFTQELVASVLNIPSNRIMCHVKRVGGGFGGKITKTAILAAVTAVAANKTGHAVRCILDRADDMLITGGRHPFLGRYKVGFMNDGRIVALCVKYYSNAGCTADESIANALLRMDNAYKIPNLLCQGCVCKTNLPSNTAFRGFGFPQSALVTETVITDVAIKTGLPQEEVRERNMYKAFDETHYKQEIDPGNMIRCWNECMQKSCFHKRKLEAEEFNKHNYWRKKGIAIIPLKYSVGFQPMYLNQVGFENTIVFSFLIAVYLDICYSKCLRAASMPGDICSLIASRELRIPTSYIYISETSTATVPNTRPTAASIGTDINGMAVKDACETLMKRLKPVMNKNPEGTWKDWVRVWCLLPKCTVSYKTHMDWEKGEGRPYEYFVFGAACSEVEVDCLTGDHKNIRTDIVMDVGCSINPAIDIGQIEGAFVQGLGLYTMEVLKYSPEGILKAYGPNQYKIPALCDIPEQFYVSLLSSSQNTSAIYSSKAIGEPALFLGSSVFFAIKDAIAAAREERGSPRIFTLNSPATPEHIRMACMDQFTEMVSKNKPDSGNPCATPSYCYSSGYFEKDV